MKKVFSDQNVTGEIYVKHKKGHEFPISFSMTTIKKEGKIVGFAGISHDITERKQAESALEERVKEFGCLHGIARLVEKHGIDIDAILKDILDIYNRHVNCYITKPVDLNQFIEIVKTIEDFWQSIVKLPPNGAK